MAAKLVVRLESGRLIDFPLLRDEVKIGRTSQKNDLVLDDLAVSREHAAIRRNGVAFFLFDLGSANGTLVNGAPVREPRRLESGDEIAIGKSTCTFLAEKPAPAPPPPDESSQVEFGEVHAVDGTIMVSLVPEELLSALKTARETPLPQAAAARPAPPEIYDETGSGRGAADRQELMRLKKKERILSLLYELGGTLGGAFTLPEIYRKASEMLFSVTPADHCLILLRDRATGELKPASVEVSESLRGPNVTEGGRQNIVISRTITSRVLREGIALLVYDAQKDFGSESIMIQAIHSVMCAPLVGKEGLLGVLYVDRRDLLSRFEKDDLDLLSAIGSQTAIAIENTVAREQLQRETQVRERLGRFLPAGVVDRVLKGEIKLGGVSQEVTTLFADIRGFTPLSEQTSPEGVVEILNEHFSIMTDAILRCGGTLDKYIGDSVMALFGAPYNNPELDPINGVNAAIQMQQGMRLVNQKLINRGLPTIKIGIGINTGRVIVGEIGSEKQMNYTAIGDAVNLAARLESNAKPGQILVSASTAARLNSDFALNPLPALKVKGKAEPVEVFEVAWGG